MLVYRTSKDYDPNIPVETALIVLVLVSSTTVTYTVVVHYFYRDENVCNFSDRNGWSIIPDIQFDLPKILGDKTHIDWFLTNTFLFLGFCCTLFVEGPDFTLNMFHGFRGIHDFLQNVSKLRQYQYYFAVSTLFLGYGATICSCCIFHAIIKDMVRHIEYTENAILVRARTRDDFYTYIRKVFMNILKR